MDWGPVEALGGSWSLEEPCLGGIAKTVLGFLIMPCGGLGGAWQGLRRD